MKNIWILLLNTISMTNPWKKSIQAHDLWIEKNFLDNIITNKIVYFLSQTFISF